MALIVVQLQDNPDGTIAFQVSGEPSVTALASMDPADFTPAQSLGALVITTIREEMQGALDARGSEGAA